jgi:hypothetical protein
MPFKDTSNLFQNTTKNFLLLVVFFVVLFSSNALSRDFPEKAILFGWVGDSITKVEENLTKKRIKFVKKPLKTGLDKLTIRNTTNLRFLTIPIKEAELIFELQKAHTFRYTFDLRHRTKLLQQLDKLYKEQTNVVSNGKDVTFEYSFSNAFIWVDFVKDKTRLYIVAPR